MLVGSLFGDFVKGRLDERYPPGIREGIRLHRKVDSFASGNPSFLGSKRRIDPAFGHWRGILVDIFYDHFLAAEWDDICGTPLPSFLRMAEEGLEENRDYLPADFIVLAQKVLGEWIPEYGRKEGIDLVLYRMSQRIRRENPLAAGGNELRRHYTQLREDFFTFLTELAGAFPG